MYLTSPPALHAFVTRRSGYQHHGILYQIESLGLWRAIHFNAAGSNQKADAIVRDTPIEDFQLGDQIVIVPVNSYAFTPEEVYLRAKRLLGLDGWNLFSCNCEHFAKWCTSGRAESGQVRTGVLAALGVAVVILAAKSA